MANNVGELFKILSKNEIFETYLKEIENNKSNSEIIDMAINNEELINILKNYVEDINIIKNKMDIIIGQKRKSYQIRCNKPVYYLISQDFYGCEVYDILNKNDCLSGIHKKTEIIKIDTEDIDNLFEIIKEEEEKLYKIIHIIKQHKNVFKVGDLIYLDFGMFCFCIKTINGKIDKTEIFPTQIIEKEKILLYNSLIDIK